MTNHTIRIKNWQLDVAMLLKDSEVDTSKDEWMDCLVKVSDELQYIHDDVLVDQATRKGFVLLNRIIITMARAEPTYELVFTEQ
jgi:hypothetical protein